MHLLQLITNPSTPPPNPVATQISQKYSPILENDSFEIAKLLHSLYRYNFAFPVWVVEPRGWKQHHFSKAITFYSSKDELDDVVTECVEREPVNIGMNRRGNGAMIQQKFGWATGGYAKSTGTHLMPNIAVYCQANVQVRHKSIGSFHVLNLVGLAFDSMDQPDVLYFLGKQPRSEKLRLFIQSHLLSAIILCYENMWNYVRACIESLKSLNRTSIQRVVLSHIGANNFASLLGLNEQQFIATIENPAIANLKSWMQSANVELIEFPNGSYFNVKDATDLQKAPATLNFPQGWERTTLFLNAWDPWSIIGNGNEQDCSLDGFWGRMSNMSVLGWPLTNPAMKFVPVDPPALSYEHHVRKQIESSTRKGIILIITGAFNPVHKTHLQLTKTVIDALNADPTFQDIHGPVLAVVMSPSSDSYVFAKEFDTPKFQVKDIHRLHMIRCGIKDLKYTNVFVDRWEMDRRGPTGAHTFTDYPDVVNHYQDVWDHWNKELGTEINVMYLCGHDHAARMPKPFIHNQGGDENIHVVVMSRGGQALPSLPTRHVVSVPVDASYIDSASSTQVRDAIREKDVVTLEKLLSPSVLGYMQQHQLYA